MPSVLPAHLWLSNGPYKTTCLRRHIVSQKYSRIIIVLYVHLRQIEETEYYDKKTRFTV